jgi:hypothetical protein
MSLRNYLDFIGTERVQKIKMDNLSQASKKLESKTKWIIQPNYE